MCLKQLFSQYALLLLLSYHPAMFIFHFLPGFVRQKWCYPFRFNMRIRDLVTSEVIFPFIAQRLSSDVCVYCNCPICCVCLRCVLYTATSMNPSEKIRSNKSSKSLNFAKLEQCYFRIFLSICGRVSSSCAVTCYGTSPLYPKSLHLDFPFHAHSGKLAPFYIILRL